MSLSCLWLFPSPVSHRQEQEQVCVVLLYSGIRMQETPTFRQHSFLLTLLPDSQGRTEAPAGRLSAAVALCLCAPASTGSHSFLNCKMHIFPHF